MRKQASLNIHEVRLLCEPFLAVARHAPEYRVPTRYASSYGLNPKVLRSSLEEYAKMDADAAWRLTQLFHDNFPKYTGRPSMSQPNLQDIHIKLTLEGASVIAKFLGLKDKD